MKIRVTSFDEAKKRLIKEIKQLQKGQLYKGLDIPQLQIMRKPPPVFEFLVENKDSGQKWNCFIRQDGTVEIYRKYEPQGYGEPSDEAII